MKTIQILAILTLIANLSFAQKITSVTEPVRQTQNHIKKDHSQKAMYQIRDHMASRIDYPEHMEGSGIEGTVILEVKIASNGLVDQATVHKGLGSSFDSLALEAIGSFDAVRVDEEKYMGSRTFRLPINFTINQ